MRKRLAKKILQRTESGIYRPDQQGRAETNIRKAVKRIEKSAAGEQA